MSYERHPHTHDHGETTPPASHGDGTDGSQDILDEESMDGEYENHKSTHPSSNDGASLHAAALQAIEKQLAEKSELLEQTHDRMLRIAADFDNSRKRWEREKTEVRTYAIQEFARDLLPVIDAFERAQKSMNDLDLDFSSPEGQKFLSIMEGVRIVSKEFEGAIKKHGVEKVPGTGTPFNPLFHNALAKVVDPSVTQDLVQEEFAPGYKIGDRVLRTAMVRVVSPD